MTDNLDLEDKKKSRRRFSPRTPEDPPLWTRHYSETYKDYYFYNNVTKESVWINTPEGIEIAKTFEVVPPREEKPLKNIIPTPPSTPPPTPPKEKELPDKFYGEWGKTKEYDPNKPIKYDVNGWPMFSSSSSEKSEGWKAEYKRWNPEGQKSSSSDKFGWDVKPDNIPLAEDYQNIKEVPKELFQPVIFE